jgi:hypothetical protein
VRYPRGKIALSAEKPRLYGKIVESAVEDSYNPLIEESPMDGLPSAHISIRGTGIDVGD